MWRYQNTERSVTVMDKAETVYVREKIVGKSNMKEKEEEKGESVSVKDTDRWKERMKEGFPGTCWSLWYAGE